MMMRIWRQLLIVLAAALLMKVTTRMTRINHLPIH